MVQFAEPIKLKIETTVEPAISPRTSQTPLRASPGGVSPLPSWPADSTQGTITLDPATGRLGQVPVPSKDPRDPLNLPAWRKWLAIIVLAILLGAIGVAETIPSKIQDMLDAEFRLDNHYPNIYYDVAGLAVPPPIDPIRNPWNNTQGLFNNPSDNIQDSVHAQQMTLLLRLPQVFATISTLTLIPLSCFLQQRLLFSITSVLATVCMIWASRSTSYGSHVAAMCCYRFATGALESLITLITHDITFVNERCKAFALLLGVDWIVSQLLTEVVYRMMWSRDWRDGYLIMLAPQTIGFLIMAFVIPRRVFPRAAAYIVGDRESIEIVEKSPRPLTRSLTNISLVPKGSFTFLSWAKGLVRFSFLPNSLWLVAYSALAGFVYEFVYYLQSELRFTAVPKYVKQAFSQSTAFNMIGAVAVFFVTGVGGDYTASILARRNGKYREAEHQLANFVVPLFMQTVGVIIAVAMPRWPHKNMHMQRAALFFENFWLGQRVIKYTYAFEAYPASAGTVSSIINFYGNLYLFAYGKLNGSVLTQDQTKQVIALVTGLMLLFALMIIPLWKYGKAIRRKWDRRPVSPATVMSLR